MLIRTARDAALGTLDPGGGPHVSHVATATANDGAPILLISDLALHTQNLKRDSRASLLFVAPHGGVDDTNTRARITLLGDVAPVADRAAARDRFLRRQPDAAMYIDFSDFKIMRFRPTTSHLVAGFGRIIDLLPESLLAPQDLAASLAETDAGACEHMNADHLDALEAMAVGLAGAAPGEWRAIGVDPQGIDLACGSDIVRVEYDQPVGEGGQLRFALKRLADSARAARADHQGTA